MTAKRRNSSDPSEKSKRDLLVRKSWSFLHDNFHKFSEDNQIKIALELCKKDMPDKNEHSGAVTIVNMGTVKISGRPLSVNIGEPVE